MKKQSIVLNSKQLTDKKNNSHNYMDNKKKGEQKQPKLTCKYCKKQPHTITDCWTLQAKNRTRQQQITKLHNQTTDNQNQKELPLTKMDKFLLSSIKKLASDFLKALTVNYNHTTKKSTQHNLCQF